MTICNACRYCEGLCAVFPAMERRAAFSRADLGYLANLCHDCRGCFYACQYAPPHEFAVNVPRVFAELRRESYERHTRPAALGRAYRRNGVVVALTAATVALLVPLIAVLAADPGVLFREHLGPGAFYEVVPMAWMVGPASAIAVATALVLLASGFRFWREGRADAPMTVAALARGAADALRLTYLGGGGDGCTYPRERFSLVRRRLHHLVFWGFALDLASTSVAAFHEHALGASAPYPLLSAPVVLGTVGGVMLVVGTSGLLWLKRHADELPSDARSVEMDLAFLWLLWATSLSGLLVLAARETAWMPALLLVHLGAVAGFFVTLPFGKFVHAVHRYLALVRFAAEERAGVGAP